MAFKCRRIKDAVAAEFGIPPKILESRIRTRAVARARMAAVYICRQDIKPEMSLPWIGRQFGRDHTTVLHACRKVPLFMKFDPAYAEHVERCRASMQL